MKLPLPMQRYTLFLTLFHASVTLTDAFCEKTVRKFVRNDRSVRASRRPKDQIPTSSSVFSSTLAPETTPELVESVERYLSKIFGTADSAEWHARRLQAQSNEDGSHDEDVQILKNIEKHELVYGELGIESLVKILDAVGVHEGDEFLDIGAGHGMLVMAASLLYPNYLKASRGIEVVPKLHELSEEYLQELHEHHVEQPDDPSTSLTPNFPSTELYLGDIYKPDDVLQEILSTTNLVVCFATTWSRGNSDINGRRLPKLSKAIQAGVLAPDARIVVIDGKLLPEDGHVYHGELRLECPDTAPYSIAYLYKYRS